MPRVKIAVTLIDRVDQNEHFLVHVEAQGKHFFKLLGPDGTMTLLAESMLEQ
jgi:hypothetical protein